MDQNVTLAVVDALDEDSAPTSGWPTSRYLTPIGNLPLIHHVLDELAQGGIERVLVVAYDGTRALENALGDGDQWGLRLSYTAAPPGDGNRALLSELLSAVAREPVLVHPGDCLFPGQVSLMCEQFSAADADLVLLGQVASARSEVGRGPSPEEFQPPRRTHAAMILGPGTGPILDGLETMTGGDDQLIESLLAGNCRFALCELGLHWCYSDATEQLLRANQMVLDSLEPGPLPDGCVELSQVAGRVEIKPSARISNSTVSGPVAIDDDAIVSDSYVGPYTAIGAGAVVSGTEIDNAIVLSGARIEHPGYRIEASVIGEGTVISRNFTLPKGLHVRLAPGSQVLLS